MESASVRYLRAYVMSFWYHSLVRFLIQKQRVRIYRTKHFPCGFVFIIYILRHSSFSGSLFYFKSVQNAKICRHAQRNDKQNEAVKTFVHIILMRVRIWGARSQKNIFRPFGPHWCKNKGEAQAPQAPPLDPPLVLL